MSLYIVAWIGICILGTKKYFLRVPNKVQQSEFIVIALILTTMLSLRFGQGTDYFSYRTIYYSISSENISFSNYSGLHGEIGYLFLCNIFRYLDIPFEGFIFIISIFEIGLLFRFAKEFEIRTPEIFIIAYPTLYMTYFMSVIRQGLIIAIFLGIILPACKKKEKGKVFLWVVICTLIHGTALMFLTLFFVDRIGIKQVRYICILMWGVGVLLTVPSVKRVFISFGIDALNYYMISGTSIRPIAIAERLTGICFATYMFSIVKKKGDSTEEYSRLYKCYLITMSSYGLFLGYESIATRLSGIMRFVEVYLFIMGIQKSKKLNKRILILILTAFETMMLAKNINSYIEQGNYYNDKNIFSYKYVSIFNEEKIFKIRNVEKKYLLQDEIDKDY